ncbi:hypothetical protein AAFF_G00376600 [Aldrovandia affinis]|uniref:Uncharacterized protein n=1 Tax=Aldrovandia affinis TaxID=143900 RepID=A0AAD7SFT5_9TELE|nr:hypothetical protein AAFF_G00376600 [Aldrovandia affinis]
MAATWTLSAARRHASIDSRRCPHTTPLRLPEPQSGGLRGANPPDEPHARQTIVLAPTAIRSHNKPIVARAPWRRKGKLIHADVRPGVEATRPRSWRTPRLRPLAMSYISSRPTWERRNLFLNPLPAALLAKA